MERRRKVTYAARGVRHVARGDGGFRFTPAAGNIPSRSRSPLSTTVLAPNPSVYLVFFLQHKYMRPGDYGLI
jgi:hypothetical protein